MKSHPWIFTAVAVTALLTPVLGLHAQGTDGTPKVELFLGYTHFGAMSTQATTGNRMVGLHGGSTSIAFNLNRHLALVGDFGGYDASELLLTGTGANLPRVADASGTVFSYLGGPRLSFNKSGRISPFFQVLAGGVHASPVTLSGCAGALCTPLPVQNTFAMTAGGGLDIRLSHHIALRVVQAEYMMTRFSNVPSGASASQNDLRLSAGLVFRFGGSSPRLPVQLTCNAQPETAFPGDSVRVTATAQNLDPRRTATYTWTSDTGPITGRSDSVNIDTAALAAGSFTVKGHVSEGQRSSQMADCSAQFTVRAFEPPTVSCTANPATVRPGESAIITASGMSPQNRPLTYSYTASGGSINGTGSSTTLSSAGASNSIVVTCNAVDDKGQTASATTTVFILTPPMPVAALPSPPPPPAPMASDLCTIHFDRDGARPTRVDNEAKGCLDDVALSLQRSSDAKLVLVGNTNATTARRRGEGSAAQRAINAKAYLVREKGIEASRISIYTGTTDARSVRITLVPSGASLDTMNMTVVEENKPRPRATR